MEYLRRDGVGSCCSECSDGVAPANARGGDGVNTAWWSRLGDPTPAVLPMVPDFRHFDPVDWTVMS